MVMTGNGQMRVMGVSPMAAMTDYALPGAVSARLQQRQIISAGKMAACTARNVQQSRTEKSTQEQIASVKGVTSPAIRAAAAKKSHALRAEYLRLISQS